MKASWLLGMAMMSTGAHAATREETIDAWMRDYTGQVPGASVLVLEDGDAVFQRSYGLADLEAGVASSPATNYRLAVSLNTAILGAAALGTLKPIAAATLHNGTTIAILLNALLGGKGLKSKPKPPSSRRRPAGAAGSVR